MKKFLDKLQKLLMVSRPFLSGTIAEYLVVTVIYSLITLVLTNFVLLHITTQLFTGGSGDATAGFLWLNFADPGINPLLSHSTLVNYPTGEQLGGPTFVTYLALWLPLRFLSGVFGPVAGLNIMMLFGFLLAGITGYWLLKRLTGSRLVAFFAGYAIAFVPYNLYKSVAHLAYLYCFSFVLIFAAFYGVWRRPTIRRGLIFAGAVALAFYTDGYYLLIGSVTLFCLLLTALAISAINKSERKVLKERVRAFAVSIGALVILSIPILYVQLSQGSQVSTMLSSSRASDPASEMRAYRTRWEDFFLPSGKHPVWSLNAGFRTVSADKELRSTPSECMNYIGYGVLALVVTGFILLLMYAFARKHSGLADFDIRTRKQLILFGAILVITTPIFLSFMFSPTAEFRGHTIYLPGQIMAHFGIGYWRVLARFFIPLHIMFVIFAALVLNIIYRATSERYGKRNLAKIVVVCMIALTSFEYLTTYNMPSFDFNKMPAGYTWLKKQKDIKVVAEFPIVDPLDSLTGYYATAQIIHDKSIVNLKEPSPDRLNNALGSIDNPEAINFAYQRGAQAIITHDIDCRNSVSWGALIYSGDKTKGDPLCIYRLERPVDSDDDFVNFGDGFQYTPVRQKPYEQQILMIGNSAELHIVNQSLEAAAPDRTVSMKASLEYVSNVLLDGSWSIEQGSKTLSEGKLTGRQTSIQADAIDTSKPVVLKVSYANGVPVSNITTYLDNTVVGKP